jgi:hypothetical protein
MKHVVGSLFAIGVAGVAAIAATSAYINSQQNIGPATNTPAANPPGQTAPPPTAPEGKTATPESGAKPAPDGTPDAKPRGAGTPDAASKPAEGDKPDADDKDPYEGIAPDDLPPDLQYDADSSVSFPTNI